MNVGLGREERRCEEGNAALLLDRAEPDARVGTRESMGGTPMLRGDGGGGRARRGEGPTAGRRAALGGERCVVGVTFLGG